VPFGRWRGGSTVAAPAFLPLVFYL
jgi:hypothetical protein